MKYKLVLSESKNLTASKAGDALSVAVGSLNSINDLVTGEDPVLGSAPEEIQAKAKEIVVNLKDLVGMLNKEVGKNKKKEEEKAEEAKPSFE